MRWIFLAIVAALAASTVFAAIEQRVDFTVYANETLKETVELTTDSPLALDSISFPLENDSVFIIYDGSYSYESGMLVLQHPITAGIDTVSFTIIRDNATRQNGELRAFGATVPAPLGGSNIVSLTLPPGYMLRTITDSDGPAISPRPDSIETKGLSKVVHWTTSGPIDIIVLYQTPEGSVPSVDGNNDFQVVSSGGPEGLSWKWQLAVAFVLLILGGSALGWFTLSRVSKQHGPMNALSEDEQKIVACLRKGLTTQKEIGVATDFSKSKMSKLIRNLEEKKILQKEPFFKTNKLALLAPWK